ncbi:hypothetical protein DFH06DRAFT_1144277 [Mycena polygramma]|nr:hypothetical protein DFH06DRAFT_1144277 [Mycena polygramma]
MLVTPTLGFEPKHALLYFFPGNLGGIYNVWRAMKQMDEHFIPRLTAQAVIRAVSCWPPQKVHKKYYVTLSLPCVSHHTGLSGGARYTRMNAQMLCCDSGKWMWRMGGEVNSRGITGKTGGYRMAEDGDGMKVKDIRGGSGEMVEIGGDVDVTRHSSAMCAETKFPTARVLQLLCHASGTVKMKLTSRSRPKTPQISLLSGALAGESSWTQKRPGLRKGGGGVEEGAKAGKSHEGKEREDGEGLPAGSCCGLRLDQLGIICQWLYGYLPRRPESSH